MSDVQVMEPSEIQPTEVGDLNNLAAIVYKKDPTNAGIKQLNFVSLKTLLDYNSYKADNIAKCIGLVKDSGTDNTKYDYEGEMIAPENTIESKIQAVADQTGVNTSTTPVVKSLKDRIDDAESDISSLDQRIGSDSSSSSLTSRISTLEGETSSITTQVDNLNSDVSSLQSVTQALGDTIGNYQTEGTIQYNILQNTNNIQTLQSLVGDENSGLISEVNNNTVNIANNTTSINTLSNITGDWLSTFGSSTITSILQMMNSRFILVNSVNWSSIVDAPDLNGLCILTGKVGYTNSNDESRYDFFCCVCSFTNGQLNTTGNVPTFTDSVTPVSYVIKITNNINDILQRELTGSGYTLKFKLSRDSQESGQLVTWTLNNVEASLINISPIV